MIKRKKNILFINLYTEMGGGEYAVLHELKELDRTQFEPIVVFNKEGEFPDKVRALNVRVEILPYETVMLKELVHPLHAWRALNASKMFYSFLKKQEIDAIHCTDVLTLLILFFPLFLLRIPIAYNSIFFYEPSRMLLFNVLALFLVKKIVSASPLLERDLLSRTILLRKRGRVITPGIDLERFQKREAGNTDVLRRELQLPEKAKVICMIGRFDPMKGQDIFIRAASILCRKRNDIIFVVVGELLNWKAIPNLKSYYEMVANLIKEHHLEKNVFMIGQRDDIPELLQSSDVVVCPSRSEGFGLVVLEALASETPVVASAGIGVLESLKNFAGVFIAERENPESFAEKIEQALNQIGNEQFQEHLRNNNQGLQEFTWKRYAQRWEETYNDCIES